MRSVLLVDESIDTLEMYKIAQYVTAEADR